MSQMNMVQSINQALAQEMERDQNVLVLGEDVGVDGGVFRVTEGLLQKFGEERVIDTPLSESGIVGTSIGMAVYGLKPVVEIQFSGFIYSAFEQLISHASRIRNRSRGRFTCPLVVRTPCSWVSRGLEHHEESTEALFIHTPGLKVVMPSNPYDAKGLLISSIRDPDPVIFFEPLRLYRAFKQEVPDEIYTIPIGEANVVKEGTDITLISYGAMMSSVLEADEILKGNNINSEVINLRTLSPLDKDTILKSVKKTGKCVVVHEAPLTCGLGAEISAIINEKALLNLEAPVIRITGFDTVVPLAKLENNYIPDVRRIVTETKNLMKF
ncbi:MAG: alpha-ketoacid dehydrogenase subunit beta [Candidatus Aenigmarchaeota archaeon]|nr:alpha-ketoacid dehydrogenase subunit beta [Candidatus Aenigmarchaeota archaeon]